MKNFKVFILYGCYFLITLNVSSQNNWPISSNINDTKAHKHYWYYRARLINDFMKLGKNQGDCMIFPQRNTVNRNTPEVQVGPDNIDIMNQYLIALALEYAQMKRANQDTRETIKEIYFMLCAYDRLDQEADQFWSASSSTTDNLNNNFNTPENGYMLREDVPHDYFSTTKNYSHFNYATTEYNWNQVQNSPIGHLKSFSGLEEINNTNKESTFSHYSQFATSGSCSHNAQTQPLNELVLSSEKYYSMFIAFMFLTKYIPLNESYVDDAGQQQYFPNGGTYQILDEVSKIINRSLAYLNGSLFNPNGNQKLWQLESPNGYITGKGDPWVFSFHINKIVSKVNEMYQNKGGTNTVCNPCTDLTTGSGLPAAAFGLMYSFTSVLSNFPTVNTPFNFGQFSLGSIIPNDLAVMEAYILAGTGQPDATLNPITQSWQLEWANLMKSVLHNSSNNIFEPNKQTYEPAVGNAPCKGPFNFNAAGGDFPTFEWSSQDRHEHADNRGSQGNPPSGYYPGVDYMLLHNLYYERLYQKSLSTNPPVYNYMDNRDQLTYPITLNLPTVNITIGNAAFPMNASLYQSLTSSARLTSTSFVNYRAGKQIRLTPGNNSSQGQGFHVERGSNFHARIARYICVNGELEKSIGNESVYLEHISLNDFDSDPMNTILQTHTVEYPVEPNWEFPEDESEGTGGSSEKGISSSSNLAMNDTTSAKFLQKIADLLISTRRASIFPNPNSGRFKVQIDNTILGEIFSVQILNTFGQVLVGIQDFNFSEIDFEDYEKGAYILKITSNKGYSSTLKMNKM